MKHPAALWGPDGTFRGLAGPSPAANGVEEPPVAFSSWVPPSAVLPPRELDPNRVPVGVPRGG